jgi:hypothetical protein
MYPSVDEKTGERSIDFGRSFDVWFEILLTTRVGFTLAAVIVTD